MSLPASRSTTYTPASPVLSVDLVALQDCIVAGKHGQLTKQVSFQSFHTLNQTDTGWTYGSFFTTAAAGNASCAIDLPVGSRILAIRMAVRDAAGGTYRFSFFKTTLATAGAGGTIVASSNATNSTGTDQTVSATGLTELITAATNYYVTWGLNTGSTAAQRIYYMEIDYDHP